MSEAENKINQLLDKLDDDAASLISTPVELASQITDLISAAISEGRSTDNALNSAFLHFDTGNDDVLKIPNTLARREEAKNFGLINGSINAIAVSEAYKNIVLTDFDTVEDLLEVLDKTEEQFAKVQNYIIISLPTELVGDEIDKALDEALEANESSVFNVITDKVLDQVISVRDEANLIIKDKIPNLASVLETDLKTAVQPLSVLTYRFYGNLDNRKKIASLNQDQNPIYLTDGVNIIS